MKDFLLKFFYSGEYAGWRNIATKLINEGECIVPSGYTIWVGGIGNFIKKSPTNLAIDCELYVFNKAEFFKSEWFKEEISREEELILTKIQELEEMKKEYNVLLKELKNYENI
jgi:hypothetical protein